MRRWIVLAVAAIVGVALLVLSLADGRGRDRATAGRDTPAAEENERPRRDAPPGAGGAGEPDADAPDTRDGTPPGPAIAGRVVDADTGASIPRARVFVLHNGTLIGEARSNDAGHFAVAGVEADVRYEVDAAADGYASALLTAAAADADRLATPGEDVRVRLRRGLLVQGRVEDPVGRPLAGARVENTGAQFRDGGVRHYSVGGRGSSIVVQADGHGRFATRGVVPAGMSYFRVRLEGYEDGHFEVDAAAWKPDEDVVVTLRPVRRLAGRVLGPDGRPREGVGVFAVRRHNAEKPVLTREDGGFEIEWRKGSIAVAAWGDGLVPAILVVAEDDAGPVEFRLAAVRPVRGVVVDDMERPVAGARVRLHHYRLLRGDEPGILASAFLTELSWSEDDVKWGLAPYAGRDVLPRPEATTDDLGRFTLAVGGPADTPTTLWLEKEGHTTAHVQWEGRPTEQLFRLPRAARLLVRALDATTGEPLADFRVLYRKAGSTSARGRANGGAGKALALSLPAGRHELEVTAKGYAKQTTDPVYVEPGVDRTMDVSLRRE